MTIGQLVERLRSLTDIREALLDAGHHEAGIALQHSIIRLYRQLMTATGAVHND